MDVEFKDDEELYDRDWDPIYGSLDSCRDLSGPKKTKLFEMYV